MRQYRIYFLLVVLSALSIYCVIQLFPGRDEGELVESVESVESLKGSGKLEGASTPRRMESNHVTSEVFASKKAGKNMGKKLGGEAGGHNAQEPSLEKLAISQLESLLENSGGDYDLQALMEEVFLDDRYDQQALVKVALSSKEPFIQDIARSLSFAESVHEKGFEVAIHEFEETLFAGGEEDAVLDFLVSEVAPQNREQTLQWLGAQDESLWQETLPAIVSEWVSEDSEQLAEWVFEMEDGALKDRALAEYITAIALDSSEAGEEKLSLIEKIGSEEVRQEVRIRTGVVSFSRSESLSP